MRFSVVALFASVLIALPACRSESPPVAPVAPASDEAPAAAAVATAVTVASIPSGAKVLLEGAELGQTPYQLRIKELTEITLSLDGFAPHTMSVDTEDPNVVVHLVALETGAAAPAADGAAAPAPAPVQKPTGPVYDTVTKAKTAYKAGAIDRVKYDQIISQLKARRATRLERLKALYEKGAIDKIEYKRRKIVIDNQYQG